MLQRCLFLVALAVSLGLLGRAWVASAEGPAPLKVLFVGDTGHHRPAERFKQLQPVLAARGIETVYTEKVSDLNAKTLAEYDGLIVYANIDQIGEAEEKALLAFVEDGKGLIALHCASYCFRNSAAYVALVGGQFKSHNTGTFRTTIAEPNHPIMKGFSGFESWDETYVHTKHNEKERTVLEYREEGNQKEPWTWVRTQGKGRVFYTAWGHDERTWGHAGFQNLVERGIRWAVGRDPAVVPPYGDRIEMTTIPKDLPPFEYVEADVPIYQPGAKSKAKQMQKPLSAADSMKHIVHPADLDLQLFVTEDQLGGKPICMNWDERGRLWVAVTVDYPNDRQPEGQGHDKILIVEDTDGDGKADKVTVFADKLSIPTSLCFANGGLIVQQAPHTLFLRSTRGDDVADERRVLFTGWGTGDTHAGPSNLHYGFDNWVYGMVGYAGFRGEVGGEKLSFGQGFYRFRPDGSKLEFLRGTNNNSWGLGFSEEGMLLGSTANGNPSVYLPIPNRHYEAVRGWSSSVLGSIADSHKFYPITDKVRQVDWHGSFTAATGHALYTARRYPPSYWNRTAFVSDPTGHLTGTLVLDRVGADFKSHYGWNLVASDDEWCAPVSAEVGPDGNVWVIDWYAFIVQHNPTPPGFKTGKGNAYETELRDKKHGRIYRLVAKADKAAPIVTLKDATPEKLVAALKSDNLFWRQHAQRLLVERGKLDVVPALFATVKDTSVDAIGLNPGAIHALWTLHGLGLLDGKNAEANAVAISALKHPSAGVRRNAALVLPRTEASLAALANANLFTKEPDAQVRLAAFLTASEVPASSNTVDVSGLTRALQLSANTEDRWLMDALTSAAATHAKAFLASAPTGKLRQSPRTAALLAVVAEHYARGGPADTVGSVLAEYRDADLWLTEPIVAGLVKGWPKGKTAALTPETDQALATLLQRLPVGAKSNLVQLATVWGSKTMAEEMQRISASLVTVLTDLKQSDSQRIAAARQVVEARPEDAALLDKVIEAITPQNAPELNAGLLEALGLGRAANVGPTLVKRLPSWSPATRTAAQRVLLGRPEWARALVEAADRGDTSLNDLSLDQKQALITHPDKAIATLAKKVMERGGGLPNADRQKVVETLLPLTKRSGDAAAGKIVFRNNCAKCHTHNGEGARIGPDLSGVAVHTKEHLLIDVMDPSRDVEGNYRVYVVSTKEGRVLTGLLASETKTSVEILDAEGKKQVVLRSDIDDQTASTKSLMPEGFEKQLKEEELVNLLEFLTKPGKYLPLSLEKVATVVSTRGMFFDEASEVERLIFPDWSPKTFEGVPFVLVDPKEGRSRNVILLNGPHGTTAPKMPKAVSLPVNAKAKAIHLLSGVSGWGFPGGHKGDVSMIVRIHYEDGKTEDHPLKNGEQFADYIRRVDVPGSKFAFALRDQQMRYLAVRPDRADKILQVELVKGSDDSAPIVMAVTVEHPE
jgi:putative membrane-bound dehydrogenase-like protein